MPAIKLSNVTVGYQNKIILQNCSSQITSGELVALIGPNGSGKSTLLQAIAGLLPISGGEILYNGQNLTNLSLSDLANIRAFLPARDETLGNFTALETVLLGRYGKSQFGFSSEKDLAAAHDALKRLEADNLSSRKISDLSSGERQRIAIARIFCQETALLLLDEPTNYLDLTHQHLLLKELQKHCQNGGTVISAIHDLNLAKRYFDRFILIDNGTISADLRSETLAHSPELVAAFKLSADLIF